MDNLGLIHIKVFSLFIL